MRTLSLQMFRYRAFPALVAAGCFAAGAEAADSPTKPPARKLELAGIENAFELAPGLCSGSQPAGDETFAALVRHGVKTIVSVDGTPPDLTAATRHGIRYVHLPFGYGGIPRGQALALSRLRESVAGPVFVHCHHGKHRGPAAAALIALAQGTFDKPQANAWLQQAGTSPDYPGLYEAVKSWWKPTTEELAKPLHPPATAPVPDLVDHTVAIDKLWERLAKHAAAASPADHGASNAVLLWEALREIERLPEDPARPPEYRVLLGKSIAAAADLKAALQAGAPPDATAAAMKRMAASCKDCHRVCRN
jgi:protein tyrosine phosphatase (PTP) superfamily phosphohydrolase (DUF442 family)